MCDKQLSGTAEIKITHYFTTSSYALTVHIVQNCFTLLKKNTKLKLDKYLKSEVSFKSETCIEIKKVGIGISILIYKLSLKKNVLCFTKSATILVVSWVYYGAHFKDKQFLLQYNFKTRSVMAFGNSISFVKKESIFFLILVSHFLYQSYCALSPLSPVIYLRRV